LTRFEIPIRRTWSKCRGAAATDIFPELVAALYVLKDGNYFLFQKSGYVSGSSSFRHDVNRGESNAVTDGKSRNTSPHWSSNGDLIAYVSTRRNKQDTDCG
jgi:Tol biopolymer transport system component